jgi:hypothetical protein
MRRRGRITTAAVLAMATIGAGAVAPAAAAPREVRPVAADVDGDGQPDAVTSREIAPGTQQLSVRVGNHDVAVTFPSRGSRPLPRPRAVDIDGDGRAELLVPRSSDAHTVTFTVWKFAPDRGLVLMRGENGTPFEVTEGSSLWAINGYSCAPNPPHAKEFVLVNVSLTSRPGETTAYSGTRTNYFVDGDRIRSNYQELIKNEPRIHSLLITNPSSCTA